MISVRELAADQLSDMYLCTGDDSHENRITLAKFAASGRKLWTKELEQMDTYWPLVLQPSASEILARLHRMKKR
ncbi:MAG: hypothetical protein ACM3X6_13250 [Patescibacteria group bacterium]